MRDSQKAQSGQHRPGKAVFRDPGRQKGEEEMNVLEIQRALSARGFNPGAVDGIWGRRTMLAVKAFQTAQGLTPDGIVGPLTLRALVGSLGTPAENGAIPLVWFEEAFNLIGTKEDETSGSNPRIIQWAKDLDIDYNDDDVPWCGLFVAHCVGATLPDEQLPAHPLRARSWEKFGEQSRPQTGAILVFWRGNPSSGNGHVGFYHSEDGQAFHVLGGNQSNEVNLCRVGKNRLTASRWPRTAATLTGTVVTAQGQGKLSHNEA
jgi:uncharacterized protein (TIGR02594 family)